MLDTLTIPETVSIPGDVVYQALLDIETVRLIEFDGESKTDEALVRAVHALAQALGGLESGDGLTPFGERLQRESSQAAAEHFTRLAACFRDEG